jgi:transcriptional regulator with XRE-family HTH domain
MFHAVEHTTTERTAAKIRAELAARKIKGPQLAGALGWSKATTWRRLNAAVPLSLEELSAIAGFLGVPLTDLLPADERPVAAATP